MNCHPLYWSMSIRAVRESIIFGDSVKQGSITMEVDTSADPYSLMIYHINSLLLSRTVTWVTFDELLPADLIVWAAHL